MICDSWECVGSWFGSGGGAAWVQAILTAAVFWWSIVSFREDQRRTHHLHERERDEARIEKIAEQERRNFERDSALVRNMVRAKLSMETFLYQIKTAQDELPDTEDYGNSRELFCGALANFMGQMTESFVYLNQLDYPDVEFYIVINKAMKNSAGVAELMSRAEKKGGGVKKSHLQQFVSTARTNAEDAKRLIKEFVDAAG